MDYLQFQFGIKTKILEERRFYILKTANDFRVLETLRHHSQEYDIYFSILPAIAYESVFDYRKNQNEHSELENEINHVTIDLKMETIRKGSPHLSPFVSKRL